MGTWPEETTGFIFLRVIFLWICLQCEEGHADKKKNFEKNEASREERKRRLLVENQLSSFSIEDMNCCYCQKASIWWNETHRSGSFGRQTQPHFEVFSWIKISVNVQVVYRELRVGNRFLVEISCQKESPSISLKKIFSETVSILFNLHWIHTLYSVSAHLHHSRLREYQGFFECIHWGL